MVKITNGRETFEVTKGAFNTIFKSQGFSIIEEGKTTDPKDEVDTSVETTENEEKSEDEIFISEIVEKPINQWTKNEVKKFGEIKGLNLKSAATFADAKNMIKEYLKDHE